MGMAEVTFIREVFGTNWEVRTKGRIVTITSTTFFQENISAVIKFAKLHEGKFVCLTRDAITFECEDVPKSTKFSVDFQTAFAKYKYNTIISELM